VSTPPLPEGRFVELPKRGRTWVRDTGGRPDAPVVLLLHGWTANADLNWFSCFTPLARAGYRVVALDHRGHGRGIRTFRRFRMRDCADDAAVLLDVLGIGSATVVGYSMGGAVAQLLWRRHPARVDALALCATAPVFAESEREKRWFTGIGAVALASRFTPRVAQKAVAGWVLDRRDTETIEWATGELQRNDWTKVLEAGNALGRFDAREWLGDIDVPTAVVLTRFDRVVSPRRQRMFVERIPGARLYVVDGDHGVVAMQPGRFVPALLDAVRAVTPAPSRV
jgi:3-oxoadipate enol-lactonase